MLRLGHGKVDIELLSISVLLPRRLLDLYRVTLR